MNEARLLATGLDFGEGPRWRDGRLWFSDFYAQAVKSVGSDGDLRTEVTIDDQPSGLGWMPDGSLLIVAMISRRLLRRAPDGTIGVHAELAAIEPYHSNDMVVDAAGRAYVGGFGFDLDAELRARGAEHVMRDHTRTAIALVQPDGAVSVTAPDMSFPNGSVITPDGRTLVVAETLARRLTAFDIDADGGLSNRRVWATTGPCVPDGICLDADGAIWVANAVAPECVRFAEGGAVLGRVTTGEPCFACMLGGADGRTLFALTAPSSSSIRVKGAGLGAVRAARVEAPHAGLP